MSNESNKSKSQVEGEPTATTSVVPIWLVIVLLLLLFTSATCNVLLFLPGLLLMGLGVGMMVTSSVNVVQSAFPEKDQGEISGVSRAASNLGSSFGTAIAGAVLISALTTVAAFVYNVCAGLTGGLELTLSERE